MQNIFNNTIKCLHRGVYKYSENLDKGKSICLENQGNSTEQAVTGLTLTRDQELAM